MNLEMWSMSNDENSIYVNHKVGIGKTNPEKELDVNFYIPISKVDINQERGH